jgi:redox-sensitive bicupin YhaK (pirin superfamily)
MGWGNLRVINEDYGLPPAPALARMATATWKSSVTSVGKSGAQGQHGQYQGYSTRRDVQRMSAGTGVHAQRVQPREGQTTHFLQIWITPNVTGIAPSYEQKTDLPDRAKAGSCCAWWRPAMALQGFGAHSCRCAHVQPGLLDAAQTASLALDPERKAYVHLVRGEIDGQRHVMLSSR